MIEAILTWLFRSALLLTLLLPFILLLRCALRPWFGSRVAYASWLLLLPALVPPLSLPRSVPVLSTNLPGLAGSQLAYTVEAGAVVGLTFGPVLLLAVWASGAMSAGLMFVRRQIQFRRLLVADADLIKAQTRKMGLVPSWLRVRYSLAIRAPMVVGCFPPVLYLPPHKAVPEPVLAHEAAHLRHGDPAWSLLFTVLRCLFWFLPWLHMAWPRFQTDQELAADESVLCQLDARERHLYGCLLAQTAGIDHPPAAQAWAARSQLKERIRMIKNQPPGRVWINSGLAVVASALLISGWILAAAAEDPAAADQPGGQDSALAGGVTARSLEPIVRIPPNFPRRAAEEKLSGHVVLEGLITTGGSVTNVNVIASEPEGVFDDAAIEAFKKWRYKPAVDDAGQLVPRTTRTMIEFDAGQ